MGEYFRIDVALRFAGGYTSIFEHLRIKFLENYANYLDDLKLLIGQKNYEEVRNMIHSLKGVTKNLGAEKLYAISYQVENQLANGLVPDFEAYFDTFTKTYQEINDYKTAA